MLTDAFEPIRRRSYSFAVPTHISPETARGLASELTNATAYNVSLESRDRLLIQERTTGGHLQIYPVLRDAELGERWARFEGVFRGVEPWPKFPDSLLQTGIVDAEQKLLGAAAEWTTAQLYAIRDAFAALVARPNATELESALPRIFTTLRSALPAATIDVVRIGHRTLSDPLLLRVLTLMPQFEDASLRDVLRQSPVTPGPSFAFFDTDPHFEILANLAYPKVTAFGLRFGSGTYIIVDYGREIRLAPHDWEERRARDIGDMPRMYAHRQFAPKSFPLFHETDRHFLRVWLTRRLAFLCAQTSHLEAGFDEPTGVLIPAAPLKDILCIRDIAALTGLTETTSDPTVLKLLFFDLIDRYGYLGGRPERPIGDILSANFIQQVVENLDADLGDYRDAVKAYILDAWQRTVDGLWDGVLDPQAKANRVLRITAPGERARELKDDAAVSRLFHVLRNTTHGYDLREGAFERFLIRHTGVIPDSVRELAIGLWLGLMSCPHVFWPTTSRFGRSRRVIAEPPQIDGVAPR